MAIQLKKGTSFNLTKKEPALKKITIGLGWDLKKGNIIDLDASVFMVGSNGKLIADEYFVFYNNLKSPDGSVQHTGDNRTGSGDGDDEIILANLSVINPAIKELIFVVTIHEATNRKQNFGMLDNAYIRLFDVETNREILKYTLDDNISTFSDMEFGRLKLEEDGWHFIATGVGSLNGLEGYVNQYA